MSNPYKEIAERMTNAETELINSIKEQFGFTTEESEKIVKVYKKVKAIKLCVWMGRYELTHGAYWDKEVMRRALEL